MHRNHDSAGVFYTSPRLLAVTEPPSGRHDNNTTKIHLHKLELPTITMSKRSNLHCSKLLLKNLVIASAGLCSPATFRIKTLPSPTSRWSHNSRNSRWRILPRPLLATKLFAAELSVKASAIGETGTPNSTNTLYPENRVDEGVEFCLCAAQRNCALC